MSELIIKKFHGDSFWIQILVQDNSFSPVDLSGATVKMCIGDVIDQEDVGVEITNGGANGTLEIFVPASLMENLELASYPFAVEVTYPGGQVDTLLVATIELMEDYI